MYAMKAYWGSVGMGPHYGTRDPVRGDWSAWHSSRFISGSHWRLGESHIRSCRFVKEKCLPCQVLKKDASFVVPVAWSLSTVRCRLNFVTKDLVKMTRGTNLMQQLWFIIINNSTCFGHPLCPSSGVQVVYCYMWCSALGVVAVVLRSRCVVLCTVCEFVTTCTPEDGHIDVRNM